MIISLDKYKGSGGEKPTEVLTQTITQNGSQTFNPQEGYVFSSAEITTNIHPTETLIATINENGIRHFDGEYNGADITVDVATSTPTGNVDINANGIYNVANYATASVNVQPSNNYSYFDGGVDVEGLRAMGWDDASIGMYRDNDRHYSWKNSDYIVSEENKALNGVIVDKTSIQNNKDNKNFKYCPFFDTSNVTDMGAMFYGCSTLTYIPRLDTSNVTSMGTMFSRCSSLTSIPQLNTSNVTDMGYMFQNCKSLTSIPALDTSKVTDMGYMFQNCKSLTSIPQLNTSNVTRMGSMFYGCSSLTSIPLLNTSNVTTMNSMFYDCSSLTSIPLLDTTNVTNMNNMFYGCSSLTSIPLLNTSNVTSMGNMFDGCSSLTSIPLLDTTNVKSMNTMFGYSNLNNLTDLGGFKNLSVSITSYFLDMCPNLTVESLMNVINNLATVSDKSLSFGSTNLNKLTAEQIAVATAKGWTLT